MRAGRTLWAWACDLIVVVKTPPSTGLYATGTGSWLRSTCSKRCRSSTGVNWVERKPTVPGAAAPLVSNPAHAASNGVARRPQSTTLRVTGRMDGSAQGRAGLILIGRGRLHGDPGAHALGDHAGDRQHREEGEQ